MTEFTPGPWEYGLNPKWQPEYGPSRELVIRPKGEFPHGLWIADCGLSVDPEHVANARLIATAPDLLAALEAIVTTSEFHAQQGVADYVRRHGHELTFRLASDAIAKARPQATSPYLNRPLRSLEQAVRDSEGKS